MLVEGYRSRYVPCLDSVVVKVIRMLLRHGTLLISDGGMFGHIMFA